MSSWRNQDGHAKLFGMRPIAEMHTYSWEFMFSACLHLYNKFRTNDGASWMNKDEEEDENGDEEEEEDEEEDSLLTSKKQFRMITQLILVEFTVLKKR